MLHNNPLLAGAALAVLMLTSVAGYATQYYTYQGYKNTQHSTPGKPAGQACKREIRQQILADRRHVQKVEFRGDSFDIRKQSSGDTKIRGRGQLLTGRNYWVDFDFKCLYDRYADRVIRASYQTTSDSDERPDYHREVKQACKHEIRDQIRADRRHVQKIKFDADNFDVRKLSNGNTRIRGRGQLLTGRNHWLEFDFKCVYDNYANRLIRASYEKTSGQDKQPDYDRDTRQACHREISRKILRNHGSATHISFDDRSLRSRRESRAETRLSGHGHFTGGRGKTRYFEFSCIYNHRQGYTRDTWVDVY